MPSDFVGRAMVMESTTASKQGAEKWMRVSCLAVGRRRSIREPLTPDPLPPGEGEEWRPRGPGSPGSFENSRGRLTPSTSRWELPLAGGARGRSAGGALLPLRGRGLLLRASLAFPAPGRRFRKRGPSRARGSGLFAGRRRLLAGDSGAGILAGGSRRLLFLPGAFLSFSLGLRHAAGELLVRDNRRLRKTFGHDVHAVLRDAQQINRHVARLLGLGEIVGGLQRMRRGLREVDGDRIGFFSLRQLKEGRPAQLGCHDVGSGPGELLHPRVALGTFEIQEKDAHEK